MLFGMLAEKEWFANGSGSELPNVLDEVSGSQEAEAALDLGRTSDALLKFQCL